ncbi:MAG TPA: acetyl-CoA carboxylase biotin carboxyl carrier protein [Candidatus Angelobacter sp.]|nr:acetyl-CoA carboxylase biotin carboxyl carrier protein [Candidatus Angelobacter sp.]
MNHKELKELIDFVIEKDIFEFELERSDVKVRIKRGVETHVAPAPHFSPSLVAMAPAVSAPPVVHPQPVAVPSSPQQPQDSDEGLHVVKSPIVGTFYESPSPGSPAFVKAGDVVEVGQVLCIIEAMKLMNEIESEVAGEIVKRHVNNSQPVEYGQPLFAVRARK